MGDERGWEMSQGRKVKGRAMSGREGGAAPAVCAALLWAVSAVAAAAAACATSAEGGAWGGSGDVDATSAAGDEEPAWESRGR